MKRTPPKPPRPSSPGRSGARTYGGASRHPLSGPHIVNGRRHPGQKGIVVLIARRAFDRLQPASDFETWRRAQQLLAVGIGSLTQCTQDDYLPLVAHFEGLAGEGGRQFEAAYRHQDEAVRQARHGLDEALRVRDLAPAYAEKICRTQYRRGLDKATAEQLCQLKFTVEARRPIPLKSAPVEVEVVADPF